MLTVVMTTYMPENEVGDRRAEYAHQTLDALLKNLVTYTPTRLHIADDGSAQGRQRVIYMLMQRAAEYWETESSYTDSARRGIGASLNKAMEYVTDEWMYITDDWILTDTLHLEGPTKLLCTRDYDLVRLGPIHPDLQCLTRFDQSVGWWLDVHQHYGGFAFATRPFLATKNFYEKIGPFDERHNSYETERLYAERVAKSPCKLAYWGGVNLSGPWQHIGNECVGYMDINDD